MVSATLEPVSVEERLAMVPRAFVGSSSALGDERWRAGDRVVKSATVSAACAYAGTAEVSVYVRARFRRRRRRTKFDRQKLIKRAPSLEITALVGHVFAA